MLSSMTVGNCWGSPAQPLEALEKLVQELGAVRKRNAQNENSNQNLLTAVRKEEENSSLLRQS